METEEGKYLFCLSLAASPFCRVCRGEATAEEPLFHPCRCSGSIRYVHQDCLEEWLSHSSKRYCELCGHEYAFSPLYDPNMPENIPKIIIARQIISSVVMYILSVVRTLFVIGMWLFVLPYIVYWLMRFYFWSSQSLFASLSSENALLAQNGGTLGTNNSTLDGSATAAVASAISMRFDGFDSWREWYSFSLNSETVAPITSFTGILNGASNSVLLVYRMIRIMVLVGALVLKASLGVQLSKETLDGAAETIMEFLAKSFEGIVMTLAAIMIFLALFILRDWILTNLPAEDNIVDEVEEQIAHGQDAQRQPDQQQQQQQNDQGQNIQQEQEHVPNRIQVQAQPIIAENPQNRPMFELPEFELPLLDDLPPGERPIHPQRHQQRSPEHTGTSSPVSDASGGSSWTSASSVSEDDVSSQSSPTRSDTYDVAQDQNEALANADVGSIGTNSGNVPTPSSSNSRSAWTYAEEAFEDDISVLSSGSAEMKGDRMADEFGGSSSSSSSSKPPTQNNDSKDTRNLSRPFTLHHSKPDDTPSSPKGKRRDDAPNPAANTQGSSTDSDGASWDFLLGESSQKTDRFSLPTDTSKQNSQSPHVDGNLPPTFTSERSRSIIGHAYNAGSAQYDAGRSSNAKYTSTSSGDEDDEDEDDDEDGDDLPLYARRLEALQQAERDRNIRIMQPNQMRAPNAEHDFGLERPDQGNPAQHLIQAGPGREAPAPIDVNPNEGEPIDNGNEPADNNPDNADDNFGDVEAADGILEAVGFRGPLFNAIQYFILVLLMVGLVLAFSAWMPFIVAQAFVLLNPIRAVLYIIHIFSKAVDTVGEFSLDIALILVWRPLRPLLVFVTNALGPFIAYGLSPLVPGARDALSMSDECFWNKLTSPDVQTLLLASLRQSWVIQLLFPWIRAAPTKTVATAPEIAASSIDIVGKTASSGFLGNIYAVATWPITFVASWIGWVADGIYDFVFSAATPTSDVREISTEFALHVWERNLWQKLVGWGIPIDSLATRLHNAVTGVSLDDRLLMISIGHVLGVFSAWGITTYMPRALRKTTIYSSAKMFLLMAKIVLFISIELLLFPILCGYCLDISLTPLASALPLPSQLKSHVSLLFDQNWTALAMHWMMGMFFMVHFARFVLHLRQVVRPGLLWFIRDPSDPNFHPIRDIIEDKMLPQQYNIARSAVMYCGIILACVGLSVLCTVYVAPKDTFPMAWDTTMQFSEYPVQVLTPMFLLPFAIMRGRPNELLHCIFRWWWKLAAHLVRLSEFIIGKRSIVDEGSWTIIRAPWLPDVLIRPFMPSRVVKDVFEIFNEHVFDEARVGQIEGALPTKEYQARFQLEIDLALSAKYPHLAFVLEGQNVRAPNTDTVPVVVGRRMVIPVDDHGRPMEDQFDYEAADYPGIRDLEENQGRDLPPPAPGSSYRDRRFNPDQHTILFVPPRLKARVLSFFALGWLGIAVVSGSTVILSLKIGRVVYNRLGDFPGHDVFALAIGLLVLLAVSVSVYRVSLQISEFYSRNADRVAVLQRLRRRITQAGTAVFKTSMCAVVFCGVVPAVYGLVVEVYFVVLFRDYIRKYGSEDMFVRSLWQAMLHNWMFGMLHVWIGSSALRFFPESYWSRQLDRLFTGPPHTWHLWEGIKVFAVPIVGVSLVGISLPFVLAIAVMWAKGTLNAQAAVELLKLEDVSMLAFCSKSVLVATLVFLATWQACFMYKQWTRLARDEAYLVGRQLHNLGETNDANQTPVPAPAPGDGEAAVAE
ncbi:hypothetical protein LPJ74_003939 [Coemansia sp. RSA 1843]|nr:hypothetical protein LPJ74_003939 [Coemansia sp. RSA 1843]